MNTITALQVALGICVFAAAMFAILWQIAKVDADNQASAAEHFEKKLQDTAAERTKWRRECEDLSDKILSTQGKLDLANRNLNKAYIRNRFGVWQRFREWEAIGDKEPRRKRKVEKLPKMPDQLLSAVTKVKEDARKPHQLIGGMQVVNCTKKQREQIYRACVKNGVPIKEDGTFMNVKFCTNVWFQPDSGRVCACLDVPHEKDINIPFSEFLARCKGEWVEN